ncbi:MAG: phage tail sheath family protein [Oscillospiraceae bacterium]|nr:phage tail sheath family protein [Oscillospiraceae bacterium]
MALGGGTFTSQNKILPGSFINFISAMTASRALSDRGIVTSPYVLDWGASGAMAEVRAEDLQKDSMKLFGYDYSAPQLMWLRDLMKGCRLGYLFRLGTGGTKAANTHAAAKYAGIRGNDLKVVIAANVDDPAKFDVTLFLGTVVVDAQTVANAGELVANDFVDWKPAPLAVTAGMPLTGGVSPTVQNSDFQAYLDASEGYSFNTMCCPSDDVTVKKLFASFTERMRDERGAKFQCVVYDSAADYEGVINVLNKTVGAAVYSAVYWVTGKNAGTPVNRSAANTVYDGEFELDVSHTQIQLETAIREGKFAFHRVGSDIRVLADINSLTTVTPEKGDIFKENQTIRVIDQLANDGAMLFNTKYLGNVPNDEDGRISLWQDLVGQRRVLQDIRAIQDFSSDDVEVLPGDSKNAVTVRDNINIAGVMLQMYMTVRIR